MQAWLPGSLLAGINSALCRQYHRYAGESFCPKDNKRILLCIFRNLPIYSKAFTRARLKNHSYHLHAPLCVIFLPNSVDVARYAAFIWQKSPTNCDTHVAESIFQTRSNQSKQTPRAPCLQPGPGQPHADKSFTVSAPPKISSPEMLQAPGSALQQSPRALTRSR